VCRWGCCPTLDGHKPTGKALPHDQGEEPLSVSDACLERGECDPNEQRYGELRVLENILWNWLMQAEKFDRARKDLHEASGPYTPAAGLGNAVEQVKQVIDVVVKAQHDLLNGLCGQDPEHPACAVRRDPGQLQGEHPDSGVERMRSRLCPSSPEHPACGG
jgi:hypothetical protein